jgi:hypothetical protein
MPALAVVLQEAMAVAKAKFARHLEHIDRLHAACGFAFATRIHIPGVLRANSKPQAV